MFPLDENEIKKLDGNDLDALSGLDAQGIFTAPSEDIESFKARLLKIGAKLKTIEDDLEKKGEFNLLNCLTLKAKDRINQEIMSEAAEITEKAYSFRIGWVPGFFLSESLSFLWGGCAISFPEECYSIFLIRSSFARMKRWFIYRRDELLSHELCHAARMPVGDRFFEEHFAYRLSFSALRRYMGNCFQYKYDSIFFILPVFLLLAVQIITTFTSWAIPVYPFWILAFVYPLFLLSRNQLCRNCCKRAERVLAEAGINNPYAVLFRCTKNEIFEISRLKRNNNGLKDFVKNKCASDLRWKVIRHRFIKDWTN